MTAPTYLEQPLPPLKVSDPPTGEVKSFFEWAEIQTTYLTTELLDPAVQKRKEELLKAINAEVSSLRIAVSSEWEALKAESSLYQEGGPPVLEAPVINSGMWRNMRNSPWLNAFTTAGKWFDRGQRHHFLTAALFLATIMHTFGQASRKEAGFVLHMARVIAQSAFMYEQSRSAGPGPFTPSPLRPDQEALLHALPTDVRTALKHLKLEPDCKTYACCPACFALYPPNSGSYPKKCTFKATPADHPCNADLLKPGGEGNNDWVPKKTFAHQTFGPWVGQLLSRPGIEKVLSKSWEVPEDGRWRDIMHSPGIQEFLGPDKSTLFSVEPDGHHHLVFSLFIDWFNPFGNKKGGKSHSVGAIYLACLNLPPSLRYRPENVYVAGIIPGPREPKLEEINHFLKVIVDDFLTYWNNAVHVTRTADSEHGAFVRAAIVPLVCDLPALRKAGGFAGHSSSQAACSFCNVSKEEMNGVDASQWRRRSWEEHLRYATEWRDAPNRATRDRVFAAHGLRWSELLRLPYWDPTKYALVDAMHNLYLGLIQHHCREVLGIDVDGKPSDEQKVVPHTPEQQEKALNDVVNAIVAGSESQLNIPRKGYIAAVAQYNGVIPESENFTKAAYAAALLDWVGLQGLHSNKGSH